MSFTLEIRAGDKQMMVAMPGPAVAGLADLEKKGFADDVRRIFGESETPPGEPRMVSRTALLESLENLLRPAKSLGNGFRVWARDFPSDAGGFSQGIAGLLIDGTYFGIHCGNDFWVIRPSGGMQGKDFPPEMRGFHRYDPAEISTENMGTVKVERKKGPRKELVELLNEIKQFLRGILDEYVVVTVG